MSELNNMTKIRNELLSDLEALNKSFKELMELVYDLCNDPRKGVQYEELIEWDEEDLKNTTSDMEKKCLEAIITIEEKLKEIV